MDSPINNIDELLSGMLDGTLTEEESRRLGRAMGKDPAIESRLDDLASIRKSLMSGRSSKKLPPDFAGSVLAEATKRADELGPGAPSWLRKEVGVAANFSKISKPAAAPKWTPSHSVLAGILTLAAVVAVGFFAFPKPERQGLISTSELNRGPDTELQASNETSTSEPDSALGLPNVITEKIADQTQPSSLGLGGAERAPASAPSSKDSMKVAIGAPGAAKEGTAVHFEANSAGIAKPNLEARDSVADVSPKSTQLPGFSVNGKQPFLMLVLDVSMAPEAIEGRVFERILDKYGIVYTDDLVLDDEQVQKLEKGQMLGKNGGTEEKVGVMFLRSTAKNLGMAIREIAEDMDYFPDFGLNMVGDDSAKLLVAQLSEVKVANSPVGFAGRLQHPAKKGNPSPFVTSSVRKSLDKTSRKNWDGMASMLPDHQDMSNTLILLRPAKK